MPDRPRNEVLGALPRTRPHRRSAKRPERPGETAPKPAATTRSTGSAGKQTPSAATTQPSRGSSKPRATAGSRSGPRVVSGSRPATRTKTKADRLRQPPQPRGIPSQPRRPVPSTPQPPEILGTVVQAAAELTEIGLSLGAQVLRRAVARLPRP